ncbi:hypothetical protein AB0L99_28280 [Streptomyces sp. NPDC051954]|uniref:hypothetical protein n=1 Tax=Streptomyces sp. NPDC051954 TaxID=3155524 RepID=UPI0034260DE0
MPEHPSRSHDFDALYADTDIGRTTVPFTWRDSADGLGVVVEGPCPRCHGRTRREIRRVMPGTGTKGLPSWLRGTPPEPATDQEVLLAERYFCACGHPHPNRPSDVHASHAGCGASWVLGSLSRNEAP